MIDELIERLKERACPAGLSYTADKPWSDHGHTDCWLHWQAADALAEAEARIEAAAIEIEATHRPDADGRLCEMCGAADGSWPCVTRTVADDLRAVLTGEADDGVDHLTWSKTQAALTGEADDAK